MASESDRGGGLWGIRIASPSFEDGGPIPARHAAAGGNVSPAINWSPGPEQTREFVVVIEDPDAKGDVPAVHWLVYGLSPDTTSLPEGAASEPGLVQGRNYTGGVGYAGPRMDEKKRHRYFVQVMALPELVRLGPGASLNELLASVRGEALNKGRIIGTYGGKASTG